MGSSGANNRPGKRGFEGVQDRNAGPPRPRNCRCGTVWEWGIGPSLRGRQRSPLQVASTSYGAASHGSHPASSPSGRDWPARIRCYRVQKGGPPCRDEHRAAPCRRKETLRRRRGAIFSIAGTKRRQALRRLRRVVIRRHPTPSWPRSRRHSRRRLRDAAIPTFQRIQPSAEIQSYAGRLAGTGAAIVGQNFAPGCSRRPSRGGRAARRPGPSMRWQYGERTSRQLRLLPTLRPSLIWATA